MGSGNRNLYCKFDTMSQEYAESYSVYPEELEKDKIDIKNNVYSQDKGYFKNPTAVSLNSFIGKDKILVDNKTIDGPITYVMDMDGNIIVGVRNNPYLLGGKSPHPTLIGGKNPQVQCAGMITLKKGRISNINNASGHYRPDKKSLDKVFDALKKLKEKAPKLFSKDFKFEERK